MKIFFKRFVVSTSCILLLLLQFMFCRSLILSKTVQRTDGALSKAATKDLWKMVKLDSHPAKIVRPEGCGLLTRLEAVVHVPHHSRNHVQEAATIETGECRCETADTVWHSTVHLCLHHYLQAESYVFFLLVAGVLHRKCDGQKRKEHSIE